MGKERSWAPPPLGGYNSLIINAAITGAVPTKPNNPHVPVTPDEIVRDALACADAGASMVHIHVRDERQHQVHDRELYERSIGPIKRARPDLIVCVTTSGRVETDIVARMTGLDLDQPFLPHMASLTLGSFNFPRSVSLNAPETIRALLIRMKERGIKPELEVFEPGMVNTAFGYMDENLIEDPPYFNILLGSMGSAPAFVGTLSHIVDRLPHGSEWAAAGIGIFQEPMVVAGVVMGGNVRTGLEDSPKNREGAPKTNVEAVEFAVKAAELVGRDIASPTEARMRLGLL